MVYYFVKAGFGFDAVDFVAEGEGDEEVREEVGHYDDLEDEEFVYLAGHVRVDHSLLDF